MTELTDKEQKEICKNILKKFDEICKENHLKYSLACGTLLGAVRHRGFIPWDDDIDICMPRNDYEKLLSLQYEDEHYKILSYRYSKNYYYLFPKMIDTRTALLEESRGEKDMGVFIDIFPIDYAGDDRAQIKKRLQQAIDSEKIWLRLGSDIRYHKSFSVNYLGKIMFKCMTFPFRKALLQYYETKYAKAQKSTYCADFVFPCGNNDYFDSALWDEIVYLPFEDITIAAFKNYDVYLTNLYGDYMTPPPAEERHTHHHFSAYRKTATD